MLLCSLRAVQGLGPAAVANPLLFFSGHHDEALAVAERGRTRAFADLLVERQTGQQDSDPYSPVTIEQVLETVNGQRGLVLYYSLAAGYLYSWLLAPGAGKDPLHTGAG